MQDPGQQTDEFGVCAARRRWHAAEDRLYPTLIGDPASYQRGVSAVRAVVAELRRRATDVRDLVAAESDPDEVLRSAGAGGVTIPAELLVAVAASLCDRELSAERERRRRAEAISAARGAGRAWVVLDGPERPEALTDGGLVTVHVPSGTAIEAAVDPWSGGDPFHLRVIPGGTDDPEPGSTFADRAPWLAEYDRRFAELDGAPLDGGREGRS